MNKHDIIVSLSNTLHSQKDAKAAVNKVFEEITLALKSGDRVVITGFGSFYPYITKMRTGRNPKTREEVIISPMRKIKFRYRKNLFKG
ncbi:MAG: HU family DNA-binding protein [Elusimicrobiota bacterium]|jgi:nucleoid DNA-binding protein|nr:HU family DNA-binding protein [Elusimicrobiota bacterium]